MARPRKEDPDLGEVVTPGPQVAVAVAQHARLDPLHLTDQANAWALEALDQPHLIHAARKTPEGRPAPAPLEAVHQALRVLEVVNRYSGGVNLTQIARETGLPQLVLARATEQLIRANLATPIGPDAYVAGNSLLLAESTTGEGRGHLRETLAWLRDAVGAAVYVARYTDGEVAITQYVDGPATPVVEEWVDFRVAAHASAVGKALLAQLDHDERKDHLARHQLTPFTPTPSPAGRTSSTNSTTVRRTHRSSTCRSTRSARCARRSRSPRVPTRNASPCPSRSPTPVG